MTDNENTWDKLLQIKTTGRDDSKAGHAYYPYEPTPYPVLERLANRGLIRKRDVVLDYTVIVTTHNPGHAYSMGGKTLIMGKRKYSFGDTEEVLTAQTLSGYYELNVTMKDIEDFKCMVFANENNNDGVKVIF